MEEVTEEQQKQVMKINSTEGGTCNLTLTKEELRIIHQSLNEVCCGVGFGDSEFSSRIGTKRADAIALLDELGTVYESL